MVTKLPQKVTSVQLPLFIKHLIMVYDVIYDLSKIFLVINTL